MKIPVEFEYQNKLYQGILAKVPGSASTQFYHVYVDHFYYGQLYETDKGWIFSNQEGWHPDLADYFEGVLISWYQ